MSIEKSLENELLAEGFLHTYVWQDGPFAFYSRPHARQWKPRILFSTVK